MDGIPVSLGICPTKDGMHKYAVAVADRVNNMLYIGSVSTMSTIIPIIKQYTPSSMVYVEVDKSLSASDYRELKEMVANVCVSDGTGSAQCLLDTASSAKLYIEREELVSKLKQIISNSVDLTLFNSYWASQSHRSVLLAVLKSESIEFTSNNEYKLYALHPNTTVYIEPTAMQALHVAGAGSNNNENTIVGLLQSGCITGCGRSYMHGLITSPVGDSTVIDDRLNFCELFLSSEIIRNVLSVKILRKFCNVENLKTKFHAAYGKKVLGGIGGLLEAKTMMGFYTTIENTIALHHAMIEIRDNLCTESIADSLNKFIDQLQKVLHKVIKYNEMMEYAVDVKQYLENGELVLRPNVSEDFDKVYKLKIGIDKKVEDYRKNVSKQLTGDAGAIKISTFDSNLMLRSTRRLRESILAKLKKKVTSSRINKNEFLFSTTDLDELVTEHRTTYNQYDRVYNECLRDLTSVACTYAAPFSEIVQLVAYLDCMLALAVHVNKSAQEYCRPQFNHDGKLAVKEARHILMEDDPQIEFVPNDAMLERTGKRLMFITGPNMGGKSTYMRTMATVCILAHVGMYVPAKYAMIPYIDRVFCRVGAGDSLLDGLSTFMAEMVEVSHLCKYATNKSLVLIDELGRGTSTRDGYGVAYSIMRHLAVDTEVITFFATHFSELSEVAESSEAQNCVESVYLNVDDNEEGGLNFTYNIKPGFCSQSLGVKVAKLASFPDCVIERAQKVLEHLEKEKKEVRGICPVD